MNYKLKILGYVFVVFLYTQCKSTATTTEINQLKEAIRLKKIEFNADFANPVIPAGVSGLENLLPPGSTIGSINLSGHTNFLIVKNDSISLHMPYYGERTRSISFNNQGGFQFKGNVDDLQTSFNNKKNNYTIKFDLKTPKENLILNLTLFAGKSANLNIISSHRRDINYLGNWKLLEEKQ